MSGILTLLLQILLVLVVAPLFTGWVRRCKSTFQGRQGAVVWQPYRDLRRLLRKEIVLAHNASRLFAATPYLVFAITWLAAAVVPTFTTMLLVEEAADLLVLIGLLGSARFLLALAGLDNGTSFGGIGASREMFIATFTEPALMAIFFALCLVTGSTSLPGIIETLLGQQTHMWSSLFLATTALAMVAIAETGRIPVDNPATHLELTMVHEAMILEYSGAHLALIEFAGMLRLLLFITLVVCILTPWGIDQTGDPATMLVGLLAYGAKMVVAAVVLAGFEISVAKMRVFRVSEFLGVALLMGVLAILLFYLAEVV